MTVKYKGPGVVRRGTNNKGIRTYTRSLLFTTTSQSEDEYHVGSHTSVPLIGSTHPTDPFAWLQTIDVDNTDPWTGWTVTLNYSSEFEMNANPLLEPFRFTIDGEKYQEAVEKDRNGNACLNSAGDYFKDPPIMRDRSNRIIRGMKLLSAVPSWLLNSEDVVNNADYNFHGLIFLKRTAKIERVTVGEKQQRNGIDFYPVNIDIQLKRSTWKVEVLQCGYKQRLGGLSLKITLGGDATDLTVPGLLDDAGAYMPNATMADAKYTNFEIYTEIDFGTLPLT